LCHLRRSFGKLRAVTVTLHDNCDYDELVYVLSHDMRAPARALRQYVILLKDTAGEDLNDDAQRFMGRLDQVLDRLDGQQHAILRLSRYGSARGEVAPRNLTAMFETAMAERDIDGDVAADLPSVECDEERLSFVVNELLDNVKNHAGEGAKVTVTHDGERFWVRDDGAGVAERVQQEVFMVFRPVPRPGTGRSGMGLSCISRVVRSLHGSIGIEVPDSGGTHVYLELPTA